MAGGKADVGVATVVVDGTLSGPAVAGMESWVLYVVVVGAKTVDIARMPGTIGGNESGEACDGA